jgi:hypothetical protein
MRKELLEGGLFEMEDANVINRMKHLFEMKDYLRDKVVAHPTATAKTKEKAMNEIQKAIYPSKLGFLVSNYVLAHESPALKVIHLK